MENEIYNIFRKNFGYVNREEKTLKEIISNKNNYIIERKNENNELIACSIINKNTIILLVVDEYYRNKGIGTSLLKESEEYIKENGYNKIIVGVGFNYLMPGIPTSEKIVPSVNEKLVPEVNNIASDFFKKHGYIYNSTSCNIFDMKMELKDFQYEDVNINSYINNIYFRWASLNDLSEVIEVADDACQYQDEKFSKYYVNENLYNENNNQRVLLAIKNDKIVGTLIVSIETEGESLGCVGCTCVKYSETHQKIATNLVKVGKKYLKDIGLKNASLSYTYTGLDKMYGESGYKISTYYMMAIKELN